MSCEQWPVAYPCDVSEVDPTVLANLREGAESLLWSLSGRRYGVCEVTEEYRSPCTDTCVPYGDRFGPGVEWALNDGRQMRMCCRIYLDHAPARAITAVYIDGDLLDPDSYALHRDTLVRLGQCWPCESDDCEAPAVKVVYEYGLDVPALGEMAMGEVICEMLRAWEGQDCRLPSNAVSVTRQGVTVNLGEASELIRDNRVGLPIADAFLRMANPNGLRSRSRVYSPDMARRVR